MTFTRTDQVASSVLVIDSDPLMLTAMGSVLDMQGHRAVLARNESVAINSITQGQFDVIILSIDQLQSGCDFAAKLRSIQTTREVPVIFLVPELASSWLPKLASNGGVYCILKPVDPHSLIDLVEKTLWLPHVARGRKGIAPPTHLASQQDWIKLSNDR
jgi:CheY-like chemotaxis protein